jgi:putative acetyltransferase
MKLVREDIGSASVRGLFAALNAELTDLYPEPGANHFELVSEEVQPGRGALLVAYEGNTAVGCCALRRIDDQTAEMKRIYVAPEARKKGTASLLLREMETEARRLGVTRLVLETGDRQPAAIALAESFGFTRVPLFGPYINSPLSVCMAKNL